MNLQIYIKELRKNGKRSFTITELVEYFQISSNYARVALHRLLKTGDLISPARGLYIIVPPEHQLFGSIPAEELVPILMKYINADYYVGLLSAAAYHGASHQKPARFQVISNKKIKHSLSFGKVKIDLIYKKSLSGLPVQDFVVNTGYLKVATPELVILDLLSYLNRVGGLNHVATILSELVESLDAVKLIKLAQDTQKEYQLQRIGYILEKIDVMDDNKKNVIIEVLAKFINFNLRNYQPLTSEVKKNGYSKCQKWKIIENANVESDL
jgi:predicted transcriptional regulator of viral defense system